MCIRDSIPQREARRIAGGDRSLTAEKPEVFRPEALESRSAALEPRRLRLRAPSLGAGVSSFLWALFFFLVLWFGMLAVGVSGATAVLLALVTSFLIFVFVHTQGAGRRR